MNRIGEKVYQHPKQDRATTIFKSLYLAAISLLFLFFLLHNLTEPATPGTFAYELFNFSNLPLLVLLLCALIIWMNWYQEFTLTDEGILFQVFIFWKKFVPWESVIALKRSWMFWGKCHILILDHLTPFHRILGLIYGLSIRPGFVILDSLPNSRDAFRIIRRKL